MLHPKHNRIDYGNQLIPPAGYELQRTIGTTYSLDLEALLILPVALFYSQPLDGDPSELRIDMLDAITKAADKITIYCQKAHIKVPHRFHYLLAYWEEGVREVQMPLYTQSFHPKIWVVRYVHPTDPPTYRVLVTSRNLTFARDWDVAFASDGKVGKEIIPTNAPLIDFLKSLEIKEAKKLSSEFYDDLLKVRFDKELGRFSKLLFHPIGIPNAVQKLYPNPISKSKWWDEILIISPFVDTTTLKSIASNSGKKRYLLSRKEELDSVNEHVLSSFHCYQFSTIIEQCELNEELNDTGANASIQNLHAKLFVSLKDDKVHWFIGSANCTDPAQGRNVEFMIEVKGEATTGIRPKDIFSQLTNPDKSEGVVLFEPYDFDKRVDVSERKSIELQIRKIKYDLAQLTILGTALPVEGATAFDLLIEIDAADLDLPPSFTVKIKPVSEDQKTAAPLKAGTLNTYQQFTGYPETRLSPFVEFEISYEGSLYTSFLLTMEIELPSTRLNKIFSSIIDSREKFFQYLSFLLTGEDGALIDEASHPHDKDSFGTAQTLFDQMPIYEKMLIAASRYPAKLGAVDKLIERLKEENSEAQTNIVSKEFEEFWAVFSTYHKSLENAE